MDARTRRSERNVRLGVLAALLAVLLFWPATPAGASPSPASATVLPEPVYAGPLAADARGVLGAPSPGSGGWYWPIGTEDFKGWSGWLAPRGAYVHVAQDMPCAAGRAVYAVGDGVVYISRADAGGYGVGGAPGGCIIITHTTAAGTRFHALYGHVYGLRVKAGQRVDAGQFIARVNGCRHLHFSVHPGTKYRDGNPYAGHVPKHWADRGGFVDPVRFLKTNPRAAAYEPPALPVTDVVTAAPPLQYGAADGAAYWTEDGGDGVVWRLDLASGAREALAAGLAPPAFDTRRYRVAPLDAPAVGFAVADRLPAVTLAARDATPVWGAEARLTLTLVNAAGEPLSGGLLKLQHSRDGRWKNVALAVTDGRGSASFRSLPAAAVALRAVFTPPSAQPEGRDYLVARSPAQTVTPHVGLTRPRLPARAAATSLITVTGRLTPRHPAGAQTVRLIFQRRDVDGAWVTARQSAAGNRDLPGGEATRYVGHARLPKGRWRVRAVRSADDLYAFTGTAWRGFVVE